MGDERGLARLGQSQPTREQEEIAWITAAQTGADPEAGTQQLRLIRFANPRSGQQVIDAAGTPAVLEALAETVFLTCSNAGFFAPHAAHLAGRQPGDTTNEHGGRQIN